jgi:lipoic acid synthetase
VLTSVTRDDLPDGGAGHFRETVLAVRRRRKIRVECLIPDFQGSPEALSILMPARPEVINHNLETVPRLYPLVRPGADYERSLSIFRHLHQFFPGTLTKSGIMVGLGEQASEVLSLFQDLRDNGCEVLTIGQYLQPGPRYHPVRRYVPPEEFDFFKAEALTRGFKAVAAGPYVRSSYQAEGLYQTAINRMRENPF